MYQGPFKALHCDQLYSLCSLCFIFQLCIMLTALRPSEDNGDIRNTKSSVCLITRIIV